MKTISEPPSDAERWASMTTKEKLDLVIDMYWTAKKVKEIGIRDQHPDWNDAKVKRAVDEAFWYARD